MTRMRRVLASGAVLAAVALVSPPRLGASGLGGVFTSTAGPMSVTRYIHAATLLADGQVLVTGGYSGSGYTASPDVYDPATNTFTPTGTMASTRIWHAATLLADGQVLG